MILAAGRNTERKRRLLQGAVAAVFLSLPIAGQGQTVAPPPVADPRWAVIVHSGYTPSSPADDGVGLVALTGGRSVDLLTPDTWRSGPNAAGSDNTEVGVGWRRARMSAVLGYVRENANSEPGAFTNEGGGRFKSRSMMGLGLALRY